MPGPAHQRPVPGLRPRRCPAGTAARRALSGLIGVTGLIGLLALPARAQAPAEPIVGRWVSVSGAEQIEIKANGFLRNCFVGNKPGSASMGAWTRTGPGKYRIELTHAVTRACSDEPRMQRRYELSIVGQATAKRDELALYLSGEFPPDRFVRAGAPAR